jgi:hypothetical protein
LSQQRRKVHTITAIVWRARINPVSLIMRLTEGEQM